MAGPAFHPDDVGNATGPEQAFDSRSDATPGVYALQHHLVLEIVAHLEAVGVPFLFRGGTALHTRLRDRRRFSMDADLTTPEPGAVQDGLRSFARRFPRSDVRLREPPDDLRVDGVRHVVDFRHARKTAGARPVRVLVEVVRGDDAHRRELLPLHADGMDWGVEVAAPTFEGFAGQKLAVLGPATIGKPVGLNPEHARPNQGVCKQVFDLRELLRLDLDAVAVRQAYVAAVGEGNRLRGSHHGVDACLADATDLLRHLRGPATRQKADPVRYGLWSGYRDSTRWIASPARPEWTQVEYRVAGGAVTRLARALAQREPDLDAVGRPVRSTRVPPEVLASLDRAQTDGASWFSEEDFGAEARVAWAWAPRELW